MDDLKALAQATGLSQTELAAAIGVSVATLIRYCNGSTKKRSSDAVDKLRALARAAS